MFLQALESSLRRHARVRHLLRLHRRGWLRAVRAARRCRAPGAAPAGPRGRGADRASAPGIRCASRPGCVSTVTSCPPTISPVEAGLPGRSARRAARRAARRRLSRRRAIGEQLAGGVARRRVGLRVEGKRPVREGQAVLDADGAAVGVVTSGGFGGDASARRSPWPTWTAAALPAGHGAASMRGARHLPVVGAKMPFVPPRYFRG
jgi:hypothetical protein